MSQSVNTTPSIHLPRHAVSGGDIMMYERMGRTLPWFVLRHAYISTTYPLGYVSQIKKFQGERRG